MGGLQRKQRWISAIVAAIAVGAPARAQEPPPEEPSRGSRFIEEIVVTAQKRAENLQDVPLSVQAFSAELLDARGIDDPFDLPFVTPGLTVTEQVSYVTTYIRGLGSDAWVLADPSVAYYIDGIYYPYTNGLVQDFGAVERIEVLKGPQGTLFGRNAIGGAINVITKAPSLDRPEASVQAGYGSFDSLTLRGHAGGPLWRNAFGISVSGVYNDGDHHVDGTAGGRGLPEEIAKAARIKLRWNPKEWLDLNITGYQLDQQGVGTNYAPNTDPSGLSTAGGAEPQDPYAGEVNDFIFYNHKNSTLYGTANVFLDWFDLKLLGSNQEVETFANVDFDGTPEPFAYFEVSPFLADVYSGEFQIISNDTSWGASRLEWIFGAYYFKSRQGFSPASFRAGEIDLEDGVIGGQPIPPPLLDAIDALGPLAIPTGTISIEALIDTDSIAGFGQATLDVTDWFALTFGGRYQSEKRTVHKSTAGLTNLDGTVTQTQDLSGDTDTTNSFKPKVSGEFRLWEDILFYVTWQQAIKSSMFNTVNFADQTVEFVHPEEIDAYEAGLKTRLFDGLVTFNIAGFQYDIENLQQQFISVLELGVVTFENAGGARIRGFDFDTAVQIFPSWVDGLSLSGGGAYLDAVYTDFRNATGFDETTGITTRNNDFTGNRVVRTPKFSGDIALAKTFAIRWGVLELAGDYYYNSGFFYLPQNSDFNEEDSYGVLGARVSFLYEPWNLRLTVFGKNVLDEEYNFSRFPNDFGANDARAPLHFYGVRFNWDY